MPRFRTTEQIFKIGAGEEYFDPNWMDSDVVITPQTKEWDYSKELKIEDVDLWEIIYQQGGGFAVYASWLPYAEFYLITLPAYLYKENSIEVYYGALASKKVYERAKDFGINLNLNKVWVEPEEMWLYQQPEPKANILVLP
jgi:hypothetical protein